MRNSKDFAKELRKLKIVPEEELRLYDASALFTSAPVDSTLVVIKDILINDVTLKIRTPLSPEKILNYWSYVLIVHIFLLKISTTSRFMGLPRDLCDFDIKWTTQGEVTTHTASNEVNIGTRTERALDFLDTCLVVNDDGSIKTKVYHKKPIRTSIL